MYLRTDDGFEIVPAADVAPGDRLLSTRPANCVEYDETTSSPTGPSSRPRVRSPRSCTGSTVAIDSPTIGERNETQYDLAERIGADRPAISDYENGKRDVPVWILGELGIRPRNSTV